MSAHQRKLTRSYHDRILAGVLSGLAHYFNWNVTVVRVLFVILLVVTGIFPAVILYLVMFAIMPSDPAHPGVLDFFKSLGELGNTIDRKPAAKQGRRKLTDVEEHDVKKNGRDE